jgi:hypothetical protein
MPEVDWEWWGLLIKGQFQEGGKDRHSVAHGMGQAPL